MNSTGAVWFGSFSAPASARRPLGPRAWTCLGLLAIPLWATWPALALRALQIPAFECLTIAFLSGWLVLRRLDTPAESPPAGTRGRASARAGWVPAVACALGLSGSNAFHIVATHYIPAAEANLISYLWPVEIIGLGALLGLFRLRTRHLIGLGLGLAGALVLMGQGALALSFTGIALAALSGLSWALYCLLRLVRQDAPGPVLKRGCALSAVLCLGLHSALEPTVLPDLGALAASAAIGVVPLALGNLVWDQGFRRGDSRLLTVMAYATPLGSALLLVVLGLEPVTAGLCLGAVLVASAGALSHSD